MNWYKTAKQVEAEWSWKRFLALPLLTLATIAGISHYALDDMLKKQDAKDVRIALVHRIQENNATQTTPATPTAIPATAPAATTPVATQTPAQTAETPTPATAENLRDMVERHEGRNNGLYHVNGIPHIGVGFNLTRPDARQLIERVGGNYQRVRSGQQRLSDEQVNRLLDITLDEASSIARNTVNNFDELPVPVQNIVTDMAFNMGQPRLSRFNNFISALERQDFARAAREMVDSRWYNQVGERSRDLVQMMRQQSR